MVWPPRRRSDRRSTQRLRRACGFSDLPVRPGSMQGMDGGLLSDIPAVDDEFGAGIERRLVGGGKAAVRSALRSHHYRGGLPSLRAFRGEVPVMAARSKPTAFSGCAPLAFRLTVADPTLLP